MTIYRGLSGVNREVKQQYRGLSGVNRTIKEQHRGYGGLNRKVFSSVVSPVLNSVRYPADLSFVFASKSGGGLGTETYSCAWNGTAFALRDYYSSAGNGLSVRFISSYLYDLTNVSRIRFLWNNRQSASSVAWVAFGTTQSTTAVPNTSQQSYQGNNFPASGYFDVDVSSLKGQHYLFIEGATSSNVTAGADFYGIEFLEN